MRILIVDDDSSTRELLQSILDGILDGQGEYDMTPDGAQAIKAFHARYEAGERYNLVIMDIMMPGMDGHQTLAQLREAEETYIETQSERVHAVMLSSLDDPETIIRAQFESGAGSYLTKPVKAEALKEALQDLRLI